MPPPPIFRAATTLQHDASAFDLSPLIETKPILKENFAPLLQYIRDEKMREMWRRICIEWNEYEEDLARWSDDGGRL